MGFADLCKVHVCVLEFMLHLGDGVLTTSMLEQHFEFSARRHDLRPNPTPETRKLTINPSIPDGRFYGGNPIPFYEQKDRMSRLFGGTNEGARPKGKKIQSWLTADKLCLQHGAL